LTENNYIIKLKLKGLISKIKFKSKVNFIIKNTNNNNKNKINHIKIKNIEIEEDSNNNNSSEKIFNSNNIYTLNFSESNSSESSKNILEKKVYEEIKLFLNSINLKIENNITKLKFRTENSKIDKLVVKGKIK
jgi:hypothetical protein